MQRAGSHAQGLLALVLLVAGSVGTSWLLGSGCGGKPDYPGCSGDDDCKKGEACVNQRCVTCRNDADCGPGQTCSDGKCNAIPNWCDQDTDCANGGVCENNACVPCKDDGQCGEGGRCRSGKCLRAGACERNEDCPEDQDCVNGTCLKAVSETSGPGCTLEAIYFGFDEYSIGENFKATMQANFTCLQQAEKQKVAIVGYTDPRGTVEYNISLSDDRAQAVITYLTRLGVDPARLRKVPRGASEARGMNEATWARDRRVELVWE